MIRSIPVSATVFALVLTTCGPGRAPDAPPDAAAPVAAAPIADGADVVLVTIDTLRADRLRLLGGTIPTPALEGLAATGVLFENAVAPAPFTLPSHSSIFTGLYPGSHGVLENVGYRLAAGVPTLAESLRRAGYRTGAFVSAFVLDRRFGLGRGFEVYADDFSVRDLEAGNLASVQRSGDETVEHALAWIRSLPSDARFFAWIHLFEPHDPYEPPEPFRSRFPDDPYAGEVAAADAQIGRLVAAVGETRQVVWIVAGDHGESLGDHGEAFHGFFVYDATVRVPLIVAGAAAGGSGGEGARRIAHPVSLVDVFPTLGELVGFEPPPHDGRSLVAELQGTGAPEPVFTATTWPRSRYGFADLDAVRVERWKLIDAPRPELYDLAADPGERTNLAAAEPRRAGELHRLLAAHRRRIADRRVAPDLSSGLSPNLSPQEEEALRALGYAGSSPRQAGDDRRFDPKDGIEIHRRLMIAESTLGQGTPESIEEVVASLEATLAAAPDLPIAQQLLGQAHLQAGRYADAGASFQRVLELDPDFQPAVFGLAASYAARGHLDDARTGFERALELDPGDRRAVWSLVDVLEASGDPAAALAVLRRAIEPERRAPALMARLADFLLKAGQVTEAADWLERASELDPSPDLGLRLASVYESLGRLEEQRLLLERLVTGSPELTEPRILLARSLMDEAGGLDRDLDRAEEMVRAALAVGPDALGYFVLADILNRRGRAREAGEAVALGRAVAGADSPAPTPAPGLR